MTTPSIRAPLASAILAITALTAPLSAWAEASAGDVLNYTTLGIWANTPLGLSARVGLAVPISKQSAVVAGQEFGLAGNKQFIGWRTFVAAHGAAWGGLEVAHWQTRSDPLMAREHNHYLGVEAQVLFFRAGVMVPKEGRRPRVTLGLGLSI